MSPGSDTESSCSQPEMLADSAVALTISSISVVLQELFYVLLFMDHDNLGQLHRLLQSTPASPAARLPMVAITITVRHLQFKTIESVLSHKTPGCYAIEIPTRFSKVCHHSACLTDVLGSSAALRGFICRAARHTPESRDCVGRHNTES